MLFTLAIFHAGFFIEIEIFTFHNKLLSVLCAISADNRGPHK